MIFSSVSVLASCKSESNTPQQTTNVTEEIKETGIDMTDDEFDDGGLALKSYVSDMNLKGYVGERLADNVRNWQVKAYHDNPNIIQQIKYAASGTMSLDMLLALDFADVDSYYDINIYESEKDFGAGSNGKALGWKVLKSGFPGGDRDIQFGKDPEAITDWSGAKELWVYVDASEFAGETQLRLAFEEQHTGRESFSLIDGSTVILYNRDGDSFLAEKVAVKSPGFVPIPGGFSGYVRLKLDSSNYIKYWDDNGNDRLDLDKVVQFQMSLRVPHGSVGKTLYIDRFEIVGEVNGEKLDDVFYPFGDSDENAWKYIDPSFTSRTVWDMKGLGKKLGNTGTITIWYGEFVGKLLTGMAYSYKAYPDPDLLRAAEEIIDDLADAQGSDGYLGVFYGGARFSLTSDNWDIWGHYHCITGLLEWYKITKNEKALNTALKALDCIYDVFKDRSYIVAGGFETNRSIAHGFAQAYQITGIERYLEEAKRIIDKDCQDANGWYKKALSGGDYYTSSSSRWEVLHMIMTLGILYEETGNKEYYNVMSSVWESILKTDIHNTGGFTTNECALGNPYLEGIIETCCTIAWMAFTNEYLKYNKTVRVADELEKSYINGMLATLMEDSKYCTYNTPMNGYVGSTDIGGYDGRRVPSQQDIAFQYNSGSPDMNCCQANLARGMGQIAEWAALTDKGDLYMNYYGPCEIVTSVRGKTVTLKQETEYPVNGKIRLTVSGAEKVKDFNLKLRIPTFTDGAVITYGDTVSNAVPGEYFTVSDIKSDNFIINIDLGIHYTYLKGKSPQTGLYSVYYGPVLLTLDNTVEQTVIPTVEQIENALPSAAVDNTMLAVDIDVNGASLRLIDFASAGKYHGEDVPYSYRSWIKIKN